MEREGQLSGLTPGSLGHGSTFLGSEMQERAVKEESGHAAESRQHQEEGKSGEMSIVTWHL